jgi:D-arabinose 1-dehydrogenase-like Zn-dependent alcohol dehydrogenase
VGGLGHLAIQMAKAIGAEVTVISLGTSKEADPWKLGADHYIATGKDLSEDVKGHEQSLDLIMSLISKFERFVSR